MDFDTEEEVLFLRKKTGCTEDEAWNYVIASNRFFDEETDCEDDASGEKLIRFVCKASSMSKRLAQQLMDAETEFLTSKDLL